mmetsp:Transcript_29234/g.56943  ORF Transcript_29234/g.56943 Transcript_29234/m.56943 type:complete len:299 (-) Transcript_29234:112-1008(-)
MISIIIKNPYAPGRDWAVKVGTDACVFDVKEKISREYEPKPCLEEQRILHNGRLLQDDFKLANLCISGENLVVFHLIIKGERFKSPSFDFMRPPPAQSMAFHPGAFVPAYRVPAMPYQQFYPLYNPSMELGGIVKPMSNSSFIASHIEEKSEREEVPRSQASESKNSPEEEKGTRTRPSCIRRFVNVKLAAKLLILILLFGQDGDSTRLFMLCFAAVITYIHQMGFLWNAVGAAANRGNVPFDGGVVGAPAEQHQQQAAARPAENQPPASPTMITYVERFIVGFFASLIPSWRPTAAV